MTPDMSTPPRHGFLARLNPIETLVLAMIALLALAGLMLIGKGLLLKSGPAIDSMPSSPQLLAPL
ncbi:hypothetical protein [Pararhizobium antarcticum]|uniref:Uncharacterized protein n=1 Tax=Pararhizobium antarcticum TaxID=1798805 RepID=A0A657LWF3_9HYPH|nr:hypothetical protein [Pararhizobium antarcticum]OJF96792.1 hypothetical protein AX760_02675 [Pararhizobium antarcticum]OJF98966.1 hypothetical protein AX761_12120 [Rhizobium sp. 58]